MTKEFYAAREHFQLTLPAGARLVCHCTAGTHEYAFWPQVLMFTMDDAFISANQGLVGTRSDPGLWAHSTLIWTYCPTFKLFWSMEYPPAAQPQSPSE